MSAVKSYRQKLLASLHIKKKELGLDDDAYRAFLMRVTKKKSAKDLSDKQIGFVLTQMGNNNAGENRGNAMQSPRTPDNPNANYDVKRKLTALWLSAYHLGIVNNQSEEALRAFIKRQLNIDHENWITPQIAYKAIEAIKAMLDRAGVDFIKHKNPRCAVMIAQWKWLFKHKEVYEGDRHAMMIFIGGCIKVDTWMMNIEELNNHQMDSMIRIFGKKIRDYQQLLKKLETR